MWHRLWGHAALSHRARALAEDLLLDYSGIQSRLGNTHANPRHHTPRATHTLIMHKHRHNATHGTRRQKRHVHYIYRHHTTRHLASALVQRRARAIIRHPRHPRHWRLSSRGVAPTTRQYQQQKRLSPRIAVTGLMPPRSPPRSPPASPRRLPHAPPFSVQPNERPIETLVSMRMTMRRNHERIVDVFRRIDADRNGAISRTELHQAFGTGTATGTGGGGAPSAAAGTVDALFESVDGNADSKIDYMELARAMRLPRVEAAPTAKVRMGAVRTKPRTAPLRTRRDASME